MTKTAPVLRMVKERIHPGQLIGSRYRLDKTIGEGGCGQVWLAIDERTDTEVAMKFPLDVLAQSAHDRFESELRVLKHLPHHPNLVRLLDDGEEGGLPYLVMEYIPLSLAGWLEKTRRTKENLNRWTVYRLFTQITEGVGEAHKLRVPGPVVHRDINPSNIMLSLEPDGRLSAKVLDFGIARLGMRRATATGQTMGTPGYMSPEQANGQPMLLSTCSDVFSLGVLAFEMLCLHHDSPISALPLACFAVQYPAELFSYFRSCRSDVPSAVWQVIVRALHPQISGRFPDASSLRIAWMKAIIYHDVPDQDYADSHSDAVVSSAMEEAVTQPYRNEDTKITSHVILDGAIEPISQDQTVSLNHHRFQRWWQSFRSAWSHGQR